MARNFLGVRRRSASRRFKAEVKEHRLAAGVGAALATWLAANIRVGKAGGESRCLQPAPNLVGRQSRLQELLANGVPCRGIGQQTPNFCFCWNLARRDSPGTGDQKNQGNRY